PCSASPPAPLSSPTRRSSDLRRIRQVSGRIPEPDCLLDLRVFAERIQVSPVPHGLRSETETAVGGESGSSGQAIATIAEDDLAADRKSTRLNSSHVKTSYAVF